MKLESRRWTRRALTIPLAVTGCLTLGAALPVLAPLALAVDLARRCSSGVPPIAARLLLGVWLYLAAEVLGLCALGGVWLAAGVGPARPARLVAWTYAVQRRWVGFLFRMISRFLRLRFEVEGDAVIRPAPVLVLIQHASLLDTLVPTVFLTERHGVRLRFVLKKELLVSPCLDLAGHRLPNAFVDRSSQESAGELARIRALTPGLGADDGVIIYPEGTRFTPARRARALERLRAHSPALAARADELRHVLPPRVGGVLTLLEAAPALDVVIVSHRGLAEFAVLGDLLSGRVVGKTVRVRVRRVPRAEVPITREDRVTWLYERWAEIDRWTEALAREAVAPSLASAAESAR